MAKVRTGAAVLVIAAVAAASAAGSFLYVNSGRKAFREAEADLPESAISTYLEDIRKGNFERIYEDSLLVSPHLNSQEDYVTALKDIYDDVNLDMLSFVEDPAKDDGIRYALVYDHVKVAELKLAKGTDGLYHASTIFGGDNNYRIEVPDGMTLVVNGIEVGKEYCVDDDARSENFHGLNDWTDAPKCDVYEIENLLGEPVITVKEGKNYTTLRDVSTGTIYVGKEGEAGLAQIMCNYAQTLARFPAQEATVGQVGAISVTASDWYSRIRTMQNAWFSAHSVSNFSNVKAFNIIQQDEKTAVGYVTFDYYAANSEVSRTWHAGYQMSLLKVNGTWRIAGMAIDSELNPLKEKNY